MVILLAAVLGFAPGAAVLGYAALMIGFSFLCFSVTRREVFTATGASS
jgi:hypothetical protein